MKLKVRFSAEADQDIAEIIEYTRAQWGDEQAQHYLAQLERTCWSIIPQNVKIASKVPKRPDLLRWRCERHIIYFRVTAATVVIVRVLHERMLPLGQR